MEQIIYSKTDRNEACRVYKLSSRSVRKLVKTTIQLQLNYMMEFLNKAIIKKPSILADTFSFSQLGEQDGFPYVYQYEMEYLNPLSQTEKDIIHIFSQADNMFEDEEGWIRRFSYEEEEQLRSQTEKTHAELYDLLRTLVEDGYQDLHDNQILKTNNGKYKAIDFESFIWFDSDGHNKLPSFLR